MRMRQTPLARMLAEPTSRPDALTAFKLARTWFTDGRRIDMGKLAGELGVSRATLFRWVGSRDDLLSAVVWSLTDPTLSRAEHEAAQGSGGRRIADVMERFCELVITSEFFGTFLQREPERALRLFTTRAMPFQGQFVARVEQLLLQQIRTGALEPPL